MKVTVSSACQGHNRCLLFDTDVFVSDDLGYVTAAGDGVVPDNEREAVALAALNCPERAIIIAEENS